MIKKRFAGLRRSFVSLKTRFLAVLTVAVALAIGSYFGITAISETIKNNVYLSDESVSAREEEYFSDLQDYVKRNGITIEDIHRIYEWREVDRYVYPLVYLDEMSNEPIEKPHDKENVPEEDEEKPPTSDTEGGEEGDTGDGEDTQDGLTWEEILERAKARQLRVITLSGDKYAYVKIVDFTDYLYTDIANMVALVVAAAIVLALMLIYIVRVTRRIGRLGVAVNAVAMGETDNRISARGSDEIAELANNVESMRSSIVENYKKAKEALDSNTDLITSMSHDIRTPLTVLLGYIDVMRIHSEDDPVMQGYLRAAESTAMRLKKLSDDMFSYFLVFGRDEISANIEPYEAQTLIEQMLSEHILLMHEHGYTVKVEGNNDSVLKDKTLHIDVQSLLRIFDNAFSNLYKYADEKYPVKIALSADPCKIFIKFTNTVKRDTDRVESNGIGLRTCKKLAERMNAEFYYGNDEDEYNVKIGLPYTALLPVQV